MGIVQHDKDDGDTNGAIEVIATFVYARSPRSGPTVYSINSRAVGRKVTPPDIAGSTSWLRTDAL
jgi:hypothetical protein